MSSATKESIDAIINWLFKIVLIIAGFFSSMFIYDIKINQEKLDSKIEVIDDKVSEIKIEQAGAKQQLRSLEKAVFKSTND